MTLPFGLDEAVREIVRDELANQAPAGGTDTMSPDGGQQLAADGTVTYDFAGHISAEGIDFTAGGTGINPDGSQIRWFRQSDGALVAYLWADSQLNFDEAMLTGLDPDDNRRAAVLRVGNDVDVGATLVEAEALDVAGGIQTSSGARTVIDSKSRSHFLQGRLSNQQAAIGEGTYPTPAAAIGAIFRVNVAIPFAVANARGIPFIVAGGGLYSSIGYVGIGATSAGVIGFDFQNNAGVALGASTMKLCWLVWTPGNPT